MRNLKRLSLFRVKDSGVWQIQGTAGVSELGIDMSEMSDVSMLFAYLATLENLVFLILTHYTKAVIMEGLGALHRLTQLTLYNLSNMMRLPGDFPPNLCYLTLKVMSLIEDPMPELGRLPKLVYLKLSTAYRGEEMVVWRHGFPSLKVLHLENMNRLRNIEIEEDAMSELKQLMIRRCRDLNIENFPEHVIAAITDAD